jgi:hypothetical protein
MRATVLKFMRTRTQMICYRLMGIFCARTVIECAHRTMKEDAGADSCLAPTDLAIELLTDNCCQIQSG